ncbi:GNAT family N-acetyltransferase [Halobacteriales archaeon SW_8_65_20]|nr:MAG: GNAT family N-acetyltransferase [Halobacteriales archaeon QH_7_65_31]PSQ30036.1 MAG: GNAT family N-acetyltransferase [Halobacteriales archaeon SW_6_65_46]PSQ53465.1 MAG: GNAT family N-acetyltransferase [Halobacteriales archaeon SW_8_65_20]
MSATVELRVIEQGDDAFVEDAWALKEAIRREEGVLRQRRGFFTDAYTRSRSVALIERTLDDERLVGFASVRRDGYILFLAVAPDERGDGHGKRLVAAVAEEYGTVTCHARTSNQNALDFYRNIGFETVRTIENYYEDYGDAYYLRLGEDSFTEKLSRFFRR